MKRRHFVKGASLSAIAVSTTGFIFYDGKSYIGDCQTTTDILGPFYRPGSPVRTDLVIEKMPGDIVTLKGNIIHDDCHTPMENAKIELWHCSAEEVYDNESADYNYRGTTFTNANGEYHFRTQLPVPYDAGGGMYRPAHFHLMISAPGYQHLITQLYFSGDQYLKQDLSSKSETAKSRILEIEKAGDGSLNVPFNVVMQRQLPVDPSVIDRLVGRYKDKAEETKIFELFNHEDQLWLKNELFGQLLEYRGDNTFAVPGTGNWGHSQFQFEIKSDGNIVAIRSIENRKGELQKHHALKLR